MGLFLILARGQVVTKGRRAVGCRRQYFVLEVVVLVIYRITKVGKDL